MIAGHCGVPGIGWIARLKMGCEAVCQQWPAGRYEKAIGVETRIAPLRLSPPSIARCITSGNTISLIKGLRLQPAQTATIIDELKGESGSLSSVLDVIRGVAS